LTKQEPKIELVYVGLHPGEEEMTADEVEEEEQVWSAERQKAAWKKRAEEEEDKLPVNIGANDDERFSVAPAVLFQIWRMKAHGLPKIEVPRSLTAKQFLDIQTMGAGD